MYMYKVGMYVRLFGVAPAPLQLGYPNSVGKAGVGRCGVGVSEGVHAEAHRGVLGHGDCRR